MFTGMAGKVALVMAGGCLLAMPAIAQQACEARPAAVYFEPGATTFNAQSKAVIERVAKEAKDCGAMRVVAETHNNERGKAISDALASQGVKVTLGNAPGQQQAISPTESIRERSAMLRVDVKQGRAG